MTQTVNNEKVKTIPSSPSKRTYHLNDDVIYIFVTYSNLYAMKHEKKLLYF